MISDAVHAVSRRNASGRHRGRKCTFDRGLMRLWCGVAGLGLGAARGGRAQVR